MNSFEYQSNGHDCYTAINHLQSNCVNCKKVRNGQPKNASLETENGSDNISYHAINSAANYLLDSTKFRPKIGIVCGSGLGSLAESIQNAEIIPYGNIPNFPVSTVDGHSGQMIFGTINTVPIMCMQGRFHYYEGYSLSECCIPIRVMKLIGITHVIITNAAGALNESYKVGDIMIIKDQINWLGLCGSNPLRGSNEARFGPRFLPMNKAFDATLRRHALDIAHELGMGEETHEGVYMCTSGPTYETVAEARMLRNLGGDCVGMSTVHEVITAKHCDIKTIAISFVSNNCITDYDCEDEPGHEEVVEAAKKKQPIITELLRRLISRIDSE